MTDKKAKADLVPIRQRTQYSCMSTSMAMCLKALGYDTNEDEVNKVMGARPMKGAQWESALACAQHYGVRGTLVCPSTVRQLKQWTDAGKPVMIAWNPEGREWSHASVVFHVDDELNVHVADPNIPDPDETVRVVSKAEFYTKWYEKWPNYLVRRPALMLDREVTPDGRQVMASKAYPGVPKKVLMFFGLPPFDVPSNIAYRDGYLGIRGSDEEIAERYGIPLGDIRAAEKNMMRKYRMAEVQNNPSSEEESKMAKKRTKTVTVDDKKDKKDVIKSDNLKRKTPAAEAAKSRKPTKGHRRKERGRAVEKGRSRKPKHKKQYASASRVATRFLLSEDSDE